MLALFRRGEGAPAALAGLGTTHIAQPLAAAMAPPAGCFAVAVDKDGRTRRIEHGARMVLAGGEQCWGVHPGPYTADLVPFKGAPEIGLRTTFAVDSADPRLAQQRFDLFLAAEVQGGLEVDAFARQVQAALAHELALGALELPPCTTFEEWNAFRAGLNQLVYTRFGVTVDDCVPVDLGDTRDYAAMLLGDRAVPASEAGVGNHAPAAPEPRHDDAAALRRLFLELPAVTGAMRLAAFPFNERKALLERLDLLGLSVGTMPSLALAAPGQFLPAPVQVRRAAHSKRAVAALDEAWALLARIESGMPGQLDEASRIVANLEDACAARRAVEGARA